MRRTRWVLAAIVCSLAGAPVGAQCAGDCDASGAVAVNELVLGVNIALDRAALDACASLDRDDDGRVAVNELVTAVNNALRGCGLTEPSTPTPTPTQDTQVGTPTATATPMATSTASPTVATATPTVTPEFIGGVSTRMLGVFSGSVVIGEEHLTGRVRVEVTESGVLATDVSMPLPHIFPNPAQMEVIAPTELVYEFTGPPLVRFTLMLNAAGHLIGRYTFDDPSMPRLPIDYDLIKEP